MANINTANASLADANTFISANNTKEPFYLYISWTNKNITIHSAGSKCLTRNNPPLDTATKNKFGQTKNGYWYGAFSTYEECVGFAYLAANFHHQSSAENFLITNGDTKNLVMIPRQPF